MPEKEQPMTFAEHQRRAAKASNVAQRGTKKAHERAKAAAKARWDKYYEENPDKRPKKKR